MFQPGCPAAYADPAYVASFGLGCLDLPACGGRLLVRPIPQTTRHDLAGASPVFACPAPHRALDDLRALGAPWVSVCLVPDPLQPFAWPALAEWATVVRELGPHQVIELHRSDATPSSHHRRMIRKAGRLPGLEIRREIDPAAFLPHWLRLYAHLAERHGHDRAPTHWLDALTLGAMLERPGTVVFSAWQGDELLGADWYLQQGRAVRAHLSAYSPRGYEHAVSYALLDQAMAGFRPEADLLDLGGVRSAHGAATEGLDHFKRGWGTTPRRRWLLGKVLDPAAYAALAPGQPAPDDAAYFPAYRAPTPTCPP